MKKTITTLLYDSWNFYTHHVRRISILILPLVILSSLLISLAHYFRSDDATILFWLPYAMALAAYPLYQGATVLYIAYTVSGNTLKPNQYYRLASQSWGVLTILYIASGLLITGGFLLLIIPGMIILARVSYGEFYCLLSQRSAIDSISDSWDATKKDQWILVAGIFGIILTIYTPLWAIEYLLTSIGLWNKLISMLLEIIGAILSPLTTIFAFRLYSLRQGEAINTDKTN